MKKWLIAFCLLILLSLLYFVYIIIPSQIIITQTETVKVTRNIAGRMFGDKRMWEEISAQNIPDNSPLNFSYNNNIYKIQKSIFNAAQVIIETKNDSLNNKIFFISSGADSTLINWTTTFPQGGINPVKRIQFYKQALACQNDIIAILDSVKNYLNVPKNIYGMKIKEESTVDTFLIAAKNQYNHYPATKDIYNLISNIKTYITANGARVTDNPIINISAIANDKYELMAAVPVNIELKGNSQFFFKRMIPGNFITTIVEGDTSKINEANNQILFFFDDFDKTSMAIPFQSLIIDRSIEKDSTKWITKWYFPVMH